MSSPHILSDTILVMSQCVGQTCGTRTSRDSPEIRVAKRGKISSWSGQSGICQVRYLGNDILGTKWQHVFCGNEGDEI